MNLKSTLLITAAMFSAATAVAASAIYRPTPFASQPECQATLTPDRLASVHDEHRLDTYYDFSCVELLGKPDGDR